MLATLGHGQPLYMLLYAAMIVFFCVLSNTAIVFNPKDTADNLKKHSGFIPGYRPGERTAEYIDYVLTRITVVGAIYLVIVCLIPRVPDLGDWRALLSGRHFAPDRGQRHARHRCADAGPSDRPPV